MILWPYRGMLIFPKVVVIAVACALYFSVYFGCIIAVGVIVFGNSFIAISVPAIIKLLTVQIIYIGVSVGIIFVLAETALSILVIQKKDI